MTKWSKCSDKLPNAYEKVLAQFQLANTPIKHIYIAFIDEKSEWNLYQLYTSFPVDKLKLIPCYWQALPPPPEEG